jgi:SAM-dependent methyltransferase
MLPDRLKAAVPWWAKIALKIVLSHLPLGYGFWARANLFRHGTMDDPTAALATWRVYHAEASARAPLPSGFAVLELGPGDSLLASAAAWGFGAGRIVASDIGAFATTTLPMLLRLDSGLRAAGLGPLPLEGAATAEEVLERIGLEYRPNGLVGLSALPAASFDLIWSNAVLEHVRRDDFAPTIAECARLLKPSGVMLHGMDFRDHLGGALNNLRFSPAVWESPLFANAGFYTNRLSPSEVVAAFEAAGLAVEFVSVERWQTIPTPREKLDPAFRDRSEADLTTRGVKLLARHARAGPEAVAPPQAPGPPKAAIPV